MTTSLLGAGRARSLLDRHGIRPDRALGQNFVIDPNTIRKVVDAASVGPDDDVLEIGAGIGSLTLGLAGAARRVIAVEFDRRLLPALDEVVAEVDNVEVLAADALRVDLAGLAARKAVANLPYNIAATLVLRLLQAAPQVAEVTVMAQREVGERLAAAPGSKAYGLPSVLVAFHGRAAVVGKVSRRAFYPVPKVDSVIVRIVRAPVRKESDPDRFAAVARAAFSQRRKTLRNTLAAVAGSVAEAEHLLESAGIDPGARAESVDLEGYLRLERALG